MRAEPPDLAITESILRTLRDEVRERGGRLTVVAIPSKLQRMSGSGYVPYQQWLLPICDRLGIDHLDLAPAFTGTLLRTYFRRSMHWNRRGHAIAADAIHAHLKRLFAERTDGA